MNNDLMLVTCPKCKIKLPSFDERGMHNFCPKVSDTREIVNICIKCKMDEVKKHWHGN